MSYREKTRGDRGGHAARLIYHWLDGRIKSHVFLCMLAYYLKWRMRRRLAPMLFDDHDKESAEARGAARNGG